VQRHRFATIIILIAFLVTSLSSCSLYRAKKDITFHGGIPDSYAEGTMSGPIINRWWEEFNDGQLSELITRALSDNLDLKRSWARLDQAQAIADQASSARWPQIAADGGASRIRTNIPVTPSGEETIPQRTTNYNLGVGASYEIDLWGRIASLDRAADYDLKATRMDLESMAMSIAAQVTEVWVSLIEQISKRTLLQSQLKTNETYLDLVELRFGRGLASSLDVYQQRQQVASLRARMPLIESQITILKHQLNILLGKSPESGIDPIVSLLPELWPQPAAGMPAELLTRRPDVRAAQMRVSSADERVGTAIADRFPALRLSAGTGYTAGSLAELFDNWIWNIAGSVSATVWDGHRKNREVKRTTSVLAEQIALYEKTFLTALKEVEDALIQEENQRIYVEKLGIQTELARKTLTEARQRYINGLGDYLPVLTALQTHQETESNLLTAQKQLVSYRIQLCRALGGTWTSGLERNTDKRNTTGENK
jgi:multidrug efflux system outer membrane protein